MLVGVGVARLDTVPSVCTLMWRRAWDRGSGCQFGAGTDFVISWRQRGGEAVLVEGWCMTRGCLLHPSINIKVIDNNFDSRRIIYGVVKHHLLLKCAAFLSFISSLLKLFVNVRICCLSLFDIVGN